MRDGWLHAQITSPDLIVPRERFHISLAHDLSCLHHIRSVGYFEGGRRILLHEQDWNGLCAQGPHYVEYLIDNEGRQPEGRLVEEEQLGL